ncbi:hypothetical protein AZH53_09595 [Methanomicrobiaceae archaeon CYW5]|uniref:AAA family ATPase n=1 Tax=Methanovulcanius yangii TaxID=1789227 RepID=UPI0029CA748D|nr:AAA family ATPase [Methanovulcanius yangii]MBT8508657.1 hypothetical protein [Methanovulcanius yangii]
MEDPTFASTNDKKAERLTDCITNIEKKFWQPSSGEENVLHKMVHLFDAINTGSYPGMTPPRGIILYGEPGTGKTHLMNLIAREMFAEGIEDKKKADAEVNKRMVVIHGPAIYSQYYGKSEENLRLAFMQAERMATKAAKAGKGRLALIYIDELDSLAPNRAETRGDLEPRIVGELLTRMDGFKHKSENYAEGHVIVIGSTNRLSKIDPALRRPGRFGSEFEFKSATSPEEISKIIEKTLKHRVGKDHHTIGESECISVGEMIFAEQKKVTEEKEVTEVTPAEILGIIHKAQMHALMNTSESGECKLNIENMKYAVENFEFKSKEESSEIKYQIQIISDIQQSDKE